MDPYFVFLNPTYVDEWKASRRMAAQPLRLGTLSFVLGMIERAARALRRFSGSIERWAGEPADPAASARQFSAH